MLPGGAKRRPSFKMVSNMVIQLLHSIKYSVEVPFSNMAQQPVDIQKGTLSSSNNPNKKVRQNPFFKFIYLTPRGWFHEAKMPKCVLQNAINISVFSLFNFIKAVTPKFLQHNTKNYDVFKVQFHFKNLPLKTPKWWLKCQNDKKKRLIWQHVAQYLLPKNWHFYTNKKCQC